MVFLLIIAVFARDNHVAFGTFAAPGEGDHVIHGELPAGKPFATVVANPGIQLILPPLGFSEFAAFLFFLLNLSFRGFQIQLSF